MVARTLLNFNTWTIGLTDKQTSGGFKGGEWGRPPPYWLIFFSKSRFFHVKGIYFVVRICN